LPDAIRNAGKQPRKVCTSDNYVTNIELPGKKEIMKKGYWVVAYRKVSSESAMQEYSKLAGPAIQANGGKPLIRTSDAIEPVEAGLKERTVVIEFESFEKAIATYRSEAYAAALKALGSGAERDFRIIEGVE
jgi:uncharacterized protein (DUF1330 family)